MSMLHLLGSFQSLFDSYGLWAVFGMILLESMGIPMPGETALITAALYAGATHRIGIVEVVATATAAAIVGDTFGYWIGRFLGLRLLVRYGRHIRLTEGRLKVGEYLFFRHGGKIVFFGRFVAFLRVLAALLAGANRMRWPRFAVMNAAGGFCWACLFGLGAYLFGEQIKWLTGPLGVIFLAIALALAAIGFLFVRRHERELEERARKALPGPLAQLDRADPPGHPRA